MLADDFMRNGAARAGNFRHVALRRFHSLPHRFGHFIGLTGGKANAAFPITNGNERIEREAATALDDFRHAIDGHHILDEFLGHFLAIIPSATASAALTTASATTTAATAAALAATATTATTAATT
jgi:hypothetical protein